jgi:hypothetical protein
MIPLLLGAEDYEEKFYRDTTHHPSSVGLYSDLGYSFYRIAFDSSEIQSTIDYDVLEVTLGLAYSYDSWMWGVYGKLLVDEIKSNVYISTTGEALGNHATIDRDEFGLYGNYTLYQKSDSSWRVNTIYRYALLSAEDSYQVYHDYRNRFKYQTHGVALSLDYGQKLTRNGLLFLNGGISYSQAVVNISQQTNGVLHDSHVDDRSSAIGGRLSFGYSHQASSQLFFNIRTDWWHTTFSKLEVSSRVGDTLPTATLQEDTHAIYGGVSWIF